MRKPNIFFHAISPTILNHLPLQKILNVNLSDFLQDPDYINAIRVIYFTYLFLNVNQLDALNFIISLFQAFTCFEHLVHQVG